MATDSEFTEQRDLRKAQRQSIEDAIEHAFSQIDDETVRDAEQTEILRLQAELERLEQTPLFMSGPQHALASSDSGYCSLAATSAHTSSSAAAAASSSGPSSTKQTPPLDANYETTVYEHITQMREHAEVLENAIGSAYMQLDDHPSRSEAEKELFRMEAKLENLQSEIKAFTVASGIKLTANGAPVDSSVVAVSSTVSVASPIFAVHHRRDIQNIPKKTRLLRLENCSDFMPTELKCVKNLNELHLLSFVNGVVPTLHEFVNLKSLFVQDVPSPWTCDGRQRYRPVVWTSDCQYPANLETLSVRGLAQSLPHAELPASVKTLHLGIGFTWDRVCKIRLPVGIKQVTLETTIPSEVNAYSVMEWLPVSVELFRCASVPVGFCLGSIKLQIMADPEILEEQCGCHGKSRERCLKLKQLHDDRNQ